MPQNPYAAYQTDATDPYAAYQQDPVPTVSAPSFGAGLFDSTVGGLLNTVKKYGYDIPMKHADDIQSQIASGDYSGALWSAVKAGADMATGNGLPLDAAKAQLAEGKKAVDAFTDEQGGSTADRTMSAIGHGLAAVTPLIGPAAAKTGEDLGNGDTGYALGEAAGLLSPFALSKALDFVPRTVKTPSLTTQLDPSEAAAVKWMDANGIPVDAATRTGNTAIRNIQGLIQNVPGTAGKAKAFVTGQRAAIDSAGDQLASAVHPTSETPETAGTGVTKTLEKSIDDLNAQASGAYTRLRNIENAATPQTVQIGTKPSTILNAQGQPVQMPVTKSITAPVDLTGAKVDLRPIADELSQVLTPAQQQFSKGLTAIKGVLGAPDAVPASVADQTLSGLKAIMREDVPAQTKYLVGKVIDKISPEVDAAVAKLGPSATQALQDGRALTTAKYAAKGTLDNLNAEPVKLVNQLTQSRDANINLLRDVASKAPGAMPAVGRSVLDGLMEKSASEPGGALTAWNKLGDNTKKILYQNPATIKDLDNYFNASKIVSKNPNPSGSGYVASLQSDGTMLVAAPHFGIPYMIGRSALGRILFSPGGAKALTDGLNLPVGATGHTAVTASRILQLAGKDATPAPQSGSQQ